MCNCRFLLKGYQLFEKKQACERNFSMSSLDCAATTCSVVFLFSDHSCLSFCGWREDGGTIFVGWIALIFSIERVFLYQ